MQNYVYMDSQEDARAPLLNQRRTQTNYAIAVSGLKSYFQALTANRLLHEQTGT